MRHENSKKKKILSMLIAAQFMTSAFVPFAYAAEATTAAPTPAPYTEDEQKPTDSDN